MAEISPRLLESTASTKRWRLKTYASPVG